MFNLACKAPTPRNGKNNKVQQQNHANGHHHAHHHHSQRLHPHVHASRSTLSLSPHWSGSERTKTDGLRGGRRTTILPTSVTNGVRTVPLANTALHAADNLSDEDGVELGLALPPTNRSPTRRRRTRVNRADIYVARIGRSGLTGCARPCGRCLEWCQWAGVRRVFHWNPETGRFDVVKVADSQGSHSYATQADKRVSSGLARLS
jgi:hypothetical protein